MGGDPFQMYAAIKMRQGVNWDILTDEEEQVLRARCKGNPAYAAALLPASVETIHRRERSIRRKLGE
jgi:hypothetical protein